MFTPHAPWGGIHSPPNPTPAPRSSLLFTAVTAWCPRCGKWRAQLADPPKRTHCHECNAWIEVQQEGRAARHQDWVLVFRRGWNPLHGRKGNP